MCFSSRSCSDSPGHLQRKAHGASVSEFSNSDYRLENRRVHFSTASPFKSSLVALLFVIGRFGLASVCRPVTKSFFPRGVPGPARHPTSARRPPPDDGGDACAAVLAACVVAGAPTFRGGVPMLSGGVLSSLRSGAANGSMAGSVCVARALGRIAGGPFRSSRPSPRARRSLAPRPCAGG